MKLDHLNFSQLYKLAQPETLMRVTKAYHKALRRAAGATDGQWLAYAAAAREFPEIENRYQSVIDFLTGPELRRALRDAADREPLPVACVGLHPFMEINRWKFPRPEVRAALATLVCLHCKRKGAKAAWRNFGDHIEIRTNQGPRGSALLMHKRGIKWGQILEFCAVAQVPVWQVFPWVPLLTDDRARVNPCVWPVNIPSVDEISQDLICT